MPRPPGLLGGGGEGAHSHHVLLGMRGSASSVFLSAPALLPTCSGHVPWRCSHASSVDALDDPSLETPNGGSCGFFQPN